MHPTTWKESSRCRMRYMAPLPMCLRVASCRNCVPRFSVVTRLLHQRRTHANELPQLRAAVQRCHGCDLYRNATQAVFGELETRTAATLTKVDLMMIGEQPGDQEDKAGRPFVGPAGRLLDRCLVEAGIDRRSVYVTNAVKHFKWQPRGKLRLHKKPSMQEVHACRPWLDAELEAMHPKLIVCLGATAAQALLGTSFRITRSRGELQHAPGLPPIVATVHPSAILRARTVEDRHRDTQSFIQDLREAKAILLSPANSSI